MISATFIAVKRDWIVVNASPWKESYGFSLVDLQFIAFPLAACISRLLHDLSSVISYKIGVSRLLDLFKSLEEVCNNFRCNSCFEISSLQLISPESTPFFLWLVLNSFFGYSSCTGRAATVLGSLNQLQRVQHQPVISVYCISEFVWKIYLNSIMSSVCPSLRTEYKFGFGVSDVDTQANQRCPSFIGSLSVGIQSLITRFPLWPSITWEI